MAWNKWNKAPTKKPPPFTWTREMLDIVGVVIKSGVKIGISPDWKHAFNYWQIDIKVNNSKWHTDPNRYEDGDVYNKVVEYYEYYYGKYKLNTNKDG
jgi:hypothetical protein